jgi:hypothetical protein
MIFALSEKLIFVVAVIIISILHSWWKKRRGEPEDESNPWPGYPPRQKPQDRPASQAPPKAPTQSWEEELRRLLRGDAPAQPAPPPVVVIQPASRPVPPPVVVQQSRPAPPPLPRGVAPRPTPAPRPVVSVGTDPDMDKGLPVKMPSLMQSAQAYLRASQLESKVAQHLQRVDEQVTKHVKVERKREASPVVRQTIGLLRDRQSQRAAILASVVLGPPKAMEP